MPFWIPCFQKKNTLKTTCNTCVSHSHSKACHHVLNEKIKKFVAPAWQKPTTPISTFFKNGPCTCSRMPGFYEDEFAWHEFHVLWGGASVTFHPVQTDIHASTHVRTHIRVHTHTNTHFPAHSLSHGTLSCTVMQIKQRSETNESDTEPDHTYTLLNQNLCGQ